jgi:ferrous iron transport protein A
MNEPRTCSLAEMATGARGTVVEVAGGRGLAGRLEALGIRPGKRITKISSEIMRGPVVVQVDRTEIAVGFGMARHILVRPE